MSRMRRDKRLNAIRIPSGWMNRLNTYNGKRILETSQFQPEDIQDKRGSLSEPHRYQNSRQCEL